MQNSLHDFNMEKILVLVNPKARQGDLFADEIQTWVKENNLTMLDDSAHSNLTLNERIYKHQKERPVVLLAGGDGTLNEALESLMETQLPLLLIPAGTANNFARTLNIPSAVKEALSILKSGQLIQVDVGLVNKIPFVNVVGLGLSTQVNQLVRSEMKRWFGVFAFVFTALKVAMRTSPFTVEVEYDGKIHRAHSWQVSICNGRNYGNGLVIHDEASLDDQTLHGLSTETKKWWHAFVLIPKLLTGKFKAKDDVTTFEGKEIHLKTRRPMQVDVDGDIKTKTPLTIEVRAKSLNVFVPKK